MNKDTETEKRGWWSVKFEITMEDKEDPIRFKDLTEASQEHICKLIFEGFTSGEICESTYGEENEH